MTETLYTSLSYNLSDEDLSVEEKDEFIELSKNLSAEKQETIYSLIINDFLKEQPTNKVMFPYKLKQNGDYLEIKLDLLPIRIKRILYKFIKIATKEEDKS